MSDERDSMFKMIFDDDFTSGDVEDGALPDPVGSILEEARFARALGKRTDGISREELQRIVPNPAGETDMPAMSKSVSDWDEVFVKSDDADTLAKLLAGELTGRAKWEAIRKHAVRAEVETDSDGITCKTTYDAAGRVLEYEVLHVNLSGDDDE